VELRHVADLRLDAPEYGRAHVTAASGLVRRGQRLYVVSDDELALAAFDAAKLGPGRLVPLDDELLPADPTRRKAVKPDLEALAGLPPRDGWPDGALLTIGSGATERRERGWLWPLDGDELTGVPVEVSLSELYKALRRDVDDLNVEGLAVAAGSLWLAQRGNGADGANLLVELALEESLAALEGSSALAPAAVGALRGCELGSVEGVPLTFSDLAPLEDGRLLFCAVAEDTDSTYYDGPCVGAAVGTLYPHGEVERLHVLPEPHKVEGVTPGEGDALLLVADPDDPAVPSPLFVADVGGA
jgi:hypothetical protein